MIPTTTRIFVCTAPVDMRRSFDGLARCTRELLEQDPASGALFLFTGKRPERSTFYIRTRQDQDRVSVAPALRQARSGIAAGPS